MKQFSHHVRQEFCCLFFQSEFRSNFFKISVRTPRPSSLEDKYLKNNYHGFYLSDLRSILVAVGLSGILKGKQKLGVTFDSDKLGGIDLTKFSKLTMCSAGASRCWLVQWPGLPPRHCTWSVLKFL